MQDDIWRAADSSYFNNDVREENFRYYEIFSLKGLVNRRETILG